MAWPANDITKISKYITDAMDQIFEHELKTTGLTADPTMVQAGRTAKTIYLATPSTKGAGDYSATAGWTKNRGKLEWEGYSLRYDRGTSFLIDALETQETSGLASVGLMAGEFLRTQMIPEIDAVRMATIAGVAKTAGFSTENESITKANIVSKITDALDAMYDRTGRDVGNIVFVNNKLRSILNGSTEYTKVRQIMEAPTGINSVIETINGNPIVFVPSRRMFSGIVLNDGDGNDGGFDNSGSEINFAIVKPGSAQGLISYLNTSMLPKGQHTEGDGDFYAYRIYHDCICPKNQRGGLYVSMAGDYDGIQVRYDANGGTGSVTDSKNYVAGDKATVKASTGLTAPAGKTFSKWNTKADGSGTDYDPDDKIDLEADVKLFAIWAS